MVLASHRLHRTTVVTNQPYILGAMAGIKHLFTPRWESIWEPVVWLEAGTQIFFSLGLAFGGLIAFSSYNPANNNCYRDALVIFFQFFQYQLNMLTKVVLSVNA